MNIRNLCATAACLASAILLAGCAPPVKVRNVLADPIQYLATRFAPGKLPQRVHDTIAQADSKPLGFRKMVVHLDWTLDADNPARATHVDQTLTMLNAGGSFVQSMINDTRNGMSVYQHYNLSYRGVYWLRFQQFSPNATLAGTMQTVHTLKHFDAIGSGKAPLDFDVTLGIPTQYAGFKSGRQACTQGADYPATKVFATLKGQAWNIDCTSYGANQAATGKRRFVFLAHYGVAIETRTVTARSVSAGRVTAVSVQ